MKSYFFDLEQQLYNLINSSPLGIDGKYFIVKDLYNSIVKAYQSFLEMPEEESSIVDDRANAEDSTNNEVVYTKTQNEDGTVNIDVTGKNLQKVLDTTLQEVVIPKKDKGEEDNSSSED